MKWRMILSALVLAFLAIVVPFLNRHPEVKEDERLRIGANELDLDAGSYTLWWQARAHPDDLPEFSDIAFRVTRSPESNSPHVTEPNNYTVTVGEDTPRMLFSVGTLRIGHAGHIILSVRLVEGVPPGELLIRRERPFLAR